MRSAERDGSGSGNSSEDDDFFEPEEAELTALQMEALEKVSAFGASGTSEGEQLNELTLWLSRCEDAGFTVPPAPAIASIMPAGKANFVDVPIACVANGSYMQFSAFHKLLLGKTKHKKEQDAADQMYLTGSVLSQWKPGKCFLAVRVSLVVVADGKLKDMHTICEAGTEISQIFATGVPIIQCFEHKNKPQFNHLKVAAYWCNATSVLVKQGFPFKQYPSIWRDKLGSQHLLLRYGLLGESYTQQAR